MSGAKRTWLVIFTLYCLFDLAISSFLSKSQSISSNIHHDPRNTPFPTVFDDSDSSESDPNEFTVSSLLWDNVLADSKYPFFKRDLLRAFPMIPSQVSHQKPLKNNQRHTLTIHNHSHDPSSTDNDWYSLLSEPVARTVPALQALLQSQPLQKPCHQILSRLPLHPCVLSASRASQSSFNLQFITCMSLTPTASDDLPEAECRNHIQDSTQYACAKELDLFCKGARYVSLQQSCLLDRILNPATLDHQTVGVVQPRKSVQVVHHDGATEAGMEATESAAVSKKAGIVNAHPKSGGHHDDNLPNYRQTRVSPRCATSVAETQSVLARMNSVVFQYATHFELLTGDHFLQALHYDLVNNQDWYNSASWWRQQVDGGDNWLDEDGFVSRSDALFSATAEERHEAALGQWKQTVEWLETLFKAADAMPSSMPPEPLMQKTLQEEQDEQGLEVSRIKGVIEEDELLLMDSETVSEILKSSAAQPVKRNRKSGRRRGDAGGIVFRFFVVIFTVFVCIFVIGWALLTRLSMLPASPMASDLEKEVMELVRQSNRWVVKRLFSSGKKNGGSVLSGAGDGEELVGLRKEGGVLGKETILDGID